MKEKIQSNNDRVLFGDDGSSESLTPTIERWIMDEGVRLGSTLASSIYEIDLLLLEAQKALSKAQPSLPGKIDIRWWQSRSGLGREPYVFKWFQLPNNQWITKRLPDSGCASFASFVKRAGAFAASARVTTQLLKDVGKLIKRRRDLLASYGASRQATTNKTQGTKRLIINCSGSISEASVASAELARHRLFNSAGG